MVPLGHLGQYRPVVQLVLWVLVILVIPGSLYLLGVQSIPGVLADRQCPVHPVDRQGPVVPPDLFHLRVHALPVGLTGQEGLQGLHYLAPLCFHDHRFDLGENACK